MKRSVNRDKTSVSPVKAIECYRGTESQCLKSRTVSHVRNQHVISVGLCWASRSFIPEDRNLQMCTCTDIKIFRLKWKLWRSQDSAASVATCYRLDEERVRVRDPIGARIFFFSLCPDRFWVWGVTLTTHIRPIRKVLRSRKRRFINTLPLMTSWQRA